jgi:predicted Zn finger-like uncharacterized protein
VIVECPRCRARYRVESDLLDQDQTFKCSRCGHIFAYQADSAGSDVAVATASEASLSESESSPLAAEDEEPRMAAPPPEPAKPEMQKPVIRKDADSLSFEFKPAETPKAPTTNEPAEHDLDDFTFEEEPIVKKEAAKPDPRRGTFGAEPRFVRGEDDLREEDEDRGNAGRPYLGFLAALVIVYALFALNLLNHPAQAEKLLGNVPVIGDVLAEDHLLQIRIQLQDVEGAYHQIKDDRLVFIVSGRAVNTSAEPLKGVQIESSLYDAGGKPIETKSIYTGNAMSLKIVKDLSSKEISLLQRLEPPKRFEIRPGESAGFSVVFLSPPSGAKEFTARVVAAQSAAS